MLECDLVIGPNNCGANGCCPFCGTRNDPRVPYEIFPCNSTEPACAECQKSRDPVLTAMLDAWYVSGTALGADRLRAAMRQNAAQNDENGA